MLVLFAEPIRTFSISHQHDATSVRRFLILCKLKKKGSIFSAYVLDGADFWAVLRTLEQYRWAYVEAQYRDGPRRRMAHLSDMVVGFLCILHSCHGAIRWMSKRMMPSDKEESKAFLKHLHCAIGSLTKGFGHLIKNRDWFYSLIQWRDDLHYDHDAVQNLFEAFGVPPRTASELADLHPRVEKNQIVAHARCRFLGKGSCYWALSVSVVFQRLQRGSLWQHRAKLAGVGARLFDWYSCLCPCASR